MKKLYAKPELNSVRLDQEISLILMSSPDDGHHGHGHGHHHCNTARENAFGGSRPQNVSGFGDSNSPW